jgi:membrane protein
MLEFRLKSLNKAIREMIKVFGDKDLGIYAAGIAYFATLSLFPFIAACVALSTIVLSPDSVVNIVKQASDIIPDEIGNLIITQFSSQAEQRTTNIITTIFALGLALFGASGAVQNFINALNHVYEVKERRNFIKARLVSIVLTVAIILGVFLMVILLTARTELLTFFKVPDPVASIILWGRWPLLIILVSFGLSMLYRYAPDRPRTRWQWMTKGAAIATAMWLIVTVFFFIYIQKFANITNTYSIFAGIIVIMIWFNLSATAIILGAQINHRLESKR